MTRIRLVAVICLLVGIIAAAVVLRRTASPPVDADATDLPAQKPAGGHSAATTPASAGAGSGARRSGENAQDLPSTALLGSVVAPVQATITVRFPAIIRRVAVVEGEEVRAGQTVIELDSTELATQENTASAAALAARTQVDRARAGLRAQQTKAESDVDAARAGLQQAEGKLQQALLARQAAADEQKADVSTATESVRKAQIAVDRAQEALKGLEELAKVGGVARADLEGARAQQQSAQSDLETARTQLRRVQAGTGGLPYRVASAQKDADAAQSSVRQARDGLATAKQAGRQSVKVAEQDVRAALAGVAQASAGLSGARASRALVRLTSPISGTVTSLLAREGETAQPSAPLATIVSLAGLRVEALVPARLLSLFHAGQRAAVSVDTAPGRVFKAVVSEIAHIAEPDGRTFRVKFELPAAPHLFPGQTAHIKVLTAKQ